MTESTPDKPEQPEQGGTPPPAPPAVGKTVTVTSSVRVGQQTGGKATGVELGTINADEVNISSVNTDGGDYAQGDVDKRQGVVAEGSTFTNSNIIGVQNNNYAAPSNIQALHQLRARVSDFQGREAEIEKLLAALSTARGGTASISGIRGLGGIGKTELAYAVAQRLSDHYPDAQLLVSLAGASATPLSPEQAFQTVIRAFEREAKLPDDLGQLHNLYISMLSGKRVLIFADDARDAAQVRPLLPPAGCALLVTTRNRFHLPGMAPLDLGTLEPPDAEALLLSICPRIAEHAPKLAQLCGYLPLALRVSAGVLANSSRPVARYLEQLEKECLKHLSDPDNPDDPQASVEASLHLSYEALEPAAQQALCQLSVFVTSFDREAALAVVEVKIDGEGLLARLLKRKLNVDCGPLLDELVRRSLLEWDEPSARYNLHDLVREFGKARLEDAEAVWLRYAGYYVRVASQAEDGLYLKGQVVAGLRLFDRERLHIDAGWGWAMTRAGQRDADDLLDRYADATAYIGSLRYDTRRERIPQLEAKLEATRRRGRRGNGSTALGNLGSAYADLGEYQRAIEFYEQHLAIARETGNRRGEGVTFGNLGSVYRNLGEYQRAIEFYEQSLAIAREIGNRRGESNAFGGLGNTYQNLDEVQRAIEFYEQSLKMKREIGDRDGESQSTWNLGLVYEQQGDLTRAIELVQASVDIKREMGHPDTEKDAAHLETLRQRLAQSQSNSPAGDEPPS